MSEQDPRRAIWRSGRPAGTIVTDARVRRVPEDPDTVRYYGGHLVAESMPTVLRDYVTALHNASVPDGHSPILVSGEYVVRAMGEGFNLLLRAKENPGSDAVVEGYHWECEHWDRGNPSTGFAPTLHEALDAAQRWADEFMAEAAREELWAPEQGWREHDADAEGA